MSQTLLQEARIIGEQLSVTEKIQLIEWLSIQLRREINTTQHVIEPDEITDGDGNTKHGTTDAEVIAPFIDDISLTWTDEEIRTMMKPHPKTGPEIVALLQKLDLSSWEGQDIPDVVEWLQDRRNQSRLQRQAQWDAIDS